MPDLWLPFQPQSITIFPPVPTVLRGDRDADVWKTCAELLWVRKEWESSLWRRHCELSSSLLHHCATLIY